MEPERKKIVASHEVEEFYWNDKMVTYINSRLTVVPYDKVDSRTIEGVILVSKHTKA